MNILWEHKALLFLFTLLFTYPVPIRQLALIDLLIVLAAGYLLITGIINTIGGII